MTPAARRVLAVLVIAVAGLVLAAAAPEKASKPGRPRAAAATPAGEGIICAAAIYSAAAEVGRQCFPGRNPEFQAELEASVAKLDNYILKNSDTTPAALATFKRDQGHVGAPKALVCQSEAVGLYAAIEKNGAARLRTGIDGMVSRPGKPSWGTCL